MMKPHPHAEVLRAIADGIPLDEFEIQLGGFHLWLPLNGYAGKLLNEPGMFAIHRRVRNINVNGFKVPEPCRVMPKVNTNYYCPSPHSPQFCLESVVTGNEYDSVALERGLMHLTKEAAIAHCKALLGFHPAVVGGAA